MKSVCQAAWLLTVAVGNLIVAVLSGAGVSKVFAKPFYDYFFYSSLVLIANIVFWRMARKYKYRAPIVEPFVELQ